MRDPDIHHAENVTVNERIANQHSHRHGARETLNDHRSTGMNLQRIGPVAIMPHDTDRYVRLCALDMDLIMRINVLDVLRDSFGQMLTLSPGMLVIFVVHMPS